MPSAESFIECEAGVYDPRDLHPWDQIPVDPGCSIIFRQMAARVQVAQALSSVCIYREQHRVRIQKVEFVYTLRFDLI